MKNSFFEVSPPCAHLWTCILEIVWSLRVGVRCYIEGMLGLTYGLSCQGYMPDCVLCVWVCDCGSCC